jgi:formate dehydrogenase subunit gamma
MDQQVAAAIDAARADGERGPLLPALHAVQAALGYVSDEAIGALAHEFTLSRADVHGVVSFYRDFRREPSGRTQVRVCRAEACQAVGSQVLTEELEARLATPLGGTTPGGEVALDEVFCLGNCALGPSASVDGRVLGRATADRILDAVRAATSSVPSKGAGA